MEGQEGGPPAIPPPAKGIIRLQAACSSIYCCRFIILGFLSLSLGYKVIQLKEVTENKAMRE